MWWVEREEIWGFGWGRGLGGEVPELQPARLGKREGGKPPFETPFGPFYGLLGAVLDL